MSWRSMSTSGRIARVAKGRRALIEAFVVKGKGMAAVAIGLGQPAAAKLALAVGGFGLAAKQKSRSCGQE